MTCDSLSWRVISWQFVCPFKLYTMDSNSFSWALNFSVVGLSETMLWYLYCRRLHPLRLVFRTPPSIFPSLSWRRWWDEDWDSGASGRKHFLCGLASHWWGILSSWKCQSCIRFRWLQAMSPWKDFWIDEYRVRLCFWSLIFGLACGRMTRLISYSGRICQR